MTDSMADREADWMQGGAGNDTYVVDDVGDTVYESPGQGIDTIESTISYALGANVENVRLTGSAPIDATGNELVNTLTETPPPMCSTADRAPIP